MDAPLTLTTPALLFPAISLLFLAYNGRFLALAALVRSLREEYEKTGRETTVAQLANLRRRLSLIRWMELAGVGAFVAAAASMLALFVGAAAVGVAWFGAALALLLVSLVLSMVEIHVSIGALNIVLGEIARK